MNSTHTVYKPSRHRPLKNTRCSRRNFSIGSADVKFISRDTARHFNMDFGTRASCSLSGFDLKNKHINKFKSNYNEKKNKIILSKIKQKNTFEANNSNEYLDKNKIESRMNKC